MSLDPTSEYARKVLEGEIVAGKYVKLACERHFSDLETCHARGMHFDTEAALDAIEFFPSLLTVTDGPIAGEPFNLLDWHTFVVGSLFGWIQEGRLRFRTVFVETGKGQAKSPLMGGIGLYVAGFRGIERAQVYTFASKLDQAKIPFKDAVALARAETPDGNPSLEDDGDVFISGAGENAWRIEFRESKSFFEAKATTDSLSGPRPDAAFADEVHEFSNGKSIDLWQAGITKKAGSAFLFMGTNTPASDQMVCTDISDRCQRILEGSVVDDTTFAYIARVDEDDDPFEDESCWIKSLPALNVTFPIKNVRDEVKKAEFDESTRLSISRLYFGIPVGSSGFWVDEASWRDCLGEIGDTEGKKCYLGLDLSEKNDLTALGAVWKDEADHLQAKCFYWSTPKGIERRSRLDRIPYAPYVEKGELSLVGTNVIDYQFVARQVKEMVAAHDVDSLTIDPAFWEKFKQACEDIDLKVWVYEGPDEDEGSGLKCVRHAQGSKIAFGERNLCMPHSITRFTDKVLEKQIVIEENRLTAYCAANVKMHTDALGNKSFIKPRQMGRIDGMVAIAMAVGASECVKSETETSIYEKRGALIL